MKLNDIVRLVYPDHCPVCGDIIPVDRQYCSCCGDELTPAGHDRCRHCGAKTGSCVCEEKDTVRLPYICAPYIYTGAVRQRLLMLKFSGKKREAEFFGTRMAIHFAADAPCAEIDAVTFVPMFEKDKKLRGYNQSELLAETVAKRLFLPKEELLKKTVHTERQHFLSFSERLGNLKGAFCLAEGAHVKNRSVLLVDDIKTTGTTLAGCADVLLKAGAAEVYCLCAAVSDYPLDF